MKEKKQLELIITQLRNLYPEIDDNLKIWRNQYLKSWIMNPKFMMKNYGMFGYKTYLARRIEENYYQKC